jgi:hypothetical protein
MKNAFYKTIVFGTVFTLAACISQTAHAQDIHADSSARMKKEKHHDNRVAHQDHRQNKADKKVDKAERKEQHQIKREAKAGNKAEKAEDRKAKQENKKEERRMRNPHKKDSILAS